MDKLLAEQEIMKKEREVQICEPLVHHLNRSEGSDYYLRSAKYYCEHDDHLIDVTLYSRSGRFSERHVQVVTAPSDRHRELRYGNDNVSKIQKRLEKYLADAGIVDSEVMIFLSEAAVCHKHPTQSGSSLRSGFRRSIVWAFGMTACWRKAYLRTAHFLNNCRSPLLLFEA